MNDDVREYTVNLETIPNAMFSYKGNLFYSDSFSNGLFILQLRDKKVKYLNELHGGVFNEYLYNSVVTSGTRAFFVPYNADSLTMFEIEQNLLENINLPSDIKNKKEKFFASEIVGNKVYMFGYRINDIYIFDIESKVYSKIDLSEEFTEIMRTSLEKGFFIRDTLVIDKLIFFSSIYQNYIFKLDTSNNKITVIPIPIECKGIYFMTLEPENQKICMVPTDGNRLFFFEVCTGNFVEKVIGEQKMEVAFSKPQYCNGFFYMMPCWGNQSVCINTKTYEVMNHEITDENLQKIDRGKGYVGGIRIEEYIVYVANSHKNRKCLIYNCRNDIFEIINTIKPRKIIKNMIKEPVNENEDFSLKNYLKLYI